ncbi:hypothetical protein ABPG72_011938 [Tetrahymena utriculariae]
MSTNIPQTAHNDVITPLLTDHYQITMCYSYFSNNKHEQEAAFEMLFRKCPFHGQYAIFAGLHELLSFIAHFKIPKEHVEYLKTQLPNDKPEFFEWLENLDCSKIKLFAMEEGSVVFPREPLIRLQGPIGILQLIETPLLNIINFATLLTTNAARMKQEAGEKAVLLEFGLRRAQGPDGGLMASQYAYLGGFHGTSNVLAGYKFGIPISGTMAHSYITSYNSLEQIKEFEINGVQIMQTALQYRNELGYDHSNESELAAFLDYARTMPHNFLALVDTYDTLHSGVPNFLVVSLALIKAGVQPKGIRLDSGDLAKLSLEARKLFDFVEQKYQLPQIKNLKIAASNDINEDSLKDINKKGHSIDIFGIGTNLVTCQKQPALGGVYKLIDLEGIPKHKLSQEAEKSTLPGKKTIYRVWNNNDPHPSADIIAKEDEVIKVGQSVIAVNINNGNERFNIKVSRVEQISVLFWNQGKLEVPYRSLQELREFSDKQKQVFNKSILTDKSKYPVLASLQYYKFFQECNEKIVISKPFQ